MKINDRVHLIDITYLGGMDGESHGHTLRFDLRTIFRFLHTAPNYPVASWPLAAR